MGSVPNLVIWIKKGTARERERRFTSSFSIGRHSDCEFQVNDTRVSRVHVKILFDSGRWWVKDQGSANGTYLNNKRIQEAPLLNEMELELGKGGPIVCLSVEKPPVVNEKPTSLREFNTETQIIQHFFNKSQKTRAGEQTMMFRRAFNRVQKKKSRKYLVTIGVAFVLLISAGSFILYQKNKISKLKSTAEDIFYSMKSLELEISKMKETAILSANAGQIATLEVKRDKFRVMEKQYDNFVKELGIYAGLSDQEKTILKIARVFGECELTMPKDFVKEVKNYINKCKSTERIKQSLNIAQAKGYEEPISKALKQYSLPPHYFYLAMQESSFNERAIGKKTRFGFAKGIWQFIPETATRYGLQVGPLKDQPVYDPFDERFNFRKATVAAAKYLKDINNTDAQASGLLVMASYNWGETRVIDIIRKMPENPKERNFWCLLKKKNIPQETYDYVFYIFSFAVICENPRLFGFDFDTPTIIKDDNLG
jgi:membrane-bound lytic murein transglycosylase D